MPDHPPIVIVGGGLVGSLLASLLGRAGYAVEVLERRGDPRADAMTEEGRSINLAISARGLNALAQLGLDDRILRLGIPLYGRVIHSRSGALASTAYGGANQAIYSFSRSELNRTLIETAAATPNVRLSFGRVCKAVDCETGTVSHVDATGGDERQARGIVIGADGAFSTVREAVASDAGRPFELTFLEYGYKQLSIPAGANGASQLDPNAMHIWPRRDFMMMAMANRDGSFTVTLYLAKIGAKSFERLADRAAVEAFFVREFPDAVPLMPSVVDDFFANPVGSMLTVRTLPWYRGDRVVLIGDAAHAIVPFYGQGANAGFEDCLELLKQLERSPDDLAAGFARFEVMRKPNTEAIAALALANFLEMRDHTGSALFRMRKRLETLLYKLFPNRFTPLYTMIAFSLIPYADARRHAIRQARTIRWTLWAALFCLMGILLRIFA